MFANTLMLEFIKAYDMSNDTKIEFLETAESFANWLENVEETEQDKLINQLNCLQIVKRRRSFTDDEIDQLAGIAENPSSNEANRVGAYLLLDAQKLAEFHFKHLTQEDQEGFKEFPIYRFWQ